MVSAQENALKKRLLAWASQYPYCAYLDTCGTWVDHYSQYDFLIAVADENAECIQDWNALQQADQEWCFGALSFDLKNKFEPGLKTDSPAAVPFSDLCFFKAQAMVWKRKGSDQIEFTGTEPLWESQELPVSEVKVKGKLASNFTREEYLATIQRLREHIRDGDCYEINLAQNFTLEARVEQPAALWRQLTKVSPTPFAAYLRLHDVHVLCASPERFLQLQGPQLVTQPIKGTSVRSRDKVEDRKLAAELRNSIKEQAENVMIVDLSRHDLYRSAVVDGVKVPHLFEVQSFAKVHHLVSTIVAEKSPGISAHVALSNTFPPGSMTGAPKFRTCELIDQYEPHARGIYAGSIGYFKPGGDFDLNVVIRSMVYDARRELISYHVGGAITWDSDPEKEYEETLVKAQAIREVLNRS